MCEHVNVWDFVCACTYIPGILLFSISPEKEGSSGMLCVGPEGANPGPRSAL